MSSMFLHEFHDALGARFTEVNGAEVVENYADTLTEHAALFTSAGVIDLSCRSRLCLLGADRQKFLNGQVTNNVKDLKTGHGCYAALVTAKGKLQSDLNIYALPEEVLLDFEPGLTGAITQRLEQFVIAEDVQVVDVAPHYGLLSVQGPKAHAALEQLALGVAPPAGLMTVASCKSETLGEIYLVNHPRLGTEGFDLFVPNASLDAVADKLVAAARSLGGRAIGWKALEMARIEAGIPRFGADMDESNLAPEAGIESRAISYTKGCYIGQEIIARIRTYGQVAKSLRRLRLVEANSPMPAKGDRILKDDKEVGTITSVVKSPRFHAIIALGYVRKEHKEPGTELIVKTSSGDTCAVVESAQ